MKNLAVKYRPNSFETVIGQQHIIEILKNQIERKELGNAYLLNGSSGTGKTTIARIFANMIDSEIIEIDAASNNGVNDVRTLNNTVLYQPIHHAKKLIIIDECHMLTTGAWNALLKTLEEPKPYVVFVLATTDPQKIPPTILSRVQRYNFTLPTQNDIKRNLMRIIKEESIFIDVDVIDYISKISNGGVRTSVVMLETCIGSENVDIEKAEKLLGRTPTKNFIEPLQAYVHGNHKLLVEHLDSYYNNGVDMKHYIKEFMYFTIDLKKYILTRDISVCKIGSNYEEDIKQVLNEIISIFDGDVDKLFNYVNSFSVKLNRVYGLSKEGFDPRYALQGVLTEVE